MITNKNIDHGKAFDWGQTSKDYAKYRDIYPEAFYKKLIELGLCTEGQDVLDLGTGTGVLPRNMYRYGASFVGADISENQIAEAKRLSEEAGMNIKYVVSAAEDIDFKEKSFDTVTACQCFMYFNVPVVMPVIHRVLKDGGHFCIMFMDWIPDKSDIAKQSENLVLRYNPSWTGAKMRRSDIVVPEDIRGLFEVEDSLVFDVNVSFTRESWNGRMKACRGIGASALSPDEIAAFEAEHMAYLASVPEKFDIPHHVTIINLRKEVSA